MKKNEILAVIAQMQEQINSLKAMVENLDNDVEEVVSTNDSEELPPLPEVIYEIPEEPIEDAIEETTTIEVIPNTNTVYEDIQLGCEILTLKNHTNWCNGSVDYIDIHLKVLAPKYEGAKPYVLWKQGIYEIDAYDIEGNLIGTSPQFVLDSLGQDIAIELRKRNVGGYVKSTYEPKHLQILC